MRLFIRVKNGQPLGNPIVEDNMRQAFPEVDLDNLPPEFAPFVRVLQPSIDRFEVYEGVTYEWNGSAYTDVHNVRPMTTAEKETAVAELQANSPGENYVWNETKLNWELVRPEKPSSEGRWTYNEVSETWVDATEPPFPSWIWVEETSSWEPPVSMPISSPTSLYEWDEATQSWTLANE